MEHTGIFGITRLVSNVEEYGIFWYIGLGGRISLYPHTFARAQPNVNIILPNISSGPEDNYNR